MYFYKIHHPANFAFAQSADPETGRLTLAQDDPRLDIQSLGSDVYRVTVQDARWDAHGSQAELSPTLPGENSYTLSLGRDGALNLVERATGKCHLRGLSRAAFGTCGAAWMFQFQHQANMEFYGLGEHNKGLEKTGQRVKFWNTDLFGDFSWHECEHGNPNPMYVALPWVIVRQKDHYVGVLVNNPGAVFMDLASDFVWDGQGPEDFVRESFYVGAPAGSPEIYILVGPSLAQLTRKLQKLVGCTPLPPIWALGHNQCRWGYAGPRDLAELDRKFRQHAIPCDGLWLDIDYMEKYKVFTFAKRLWGNPAKIRREIQKLAANGRRVVVILDPGVKVQTGYDVYESGKRGGVFCLNSSGTPFVGYVWPGQTNFPDFSLDATRKWWAQRVRELADLGVGGVWLDMNDPSIGAVELDEMRFDRGAKPHASYHNQYALGMAQATQAGFLAARPNTRPFLLSRSAYISSSRYAAVWTGDNVSNWHHLRMSIPVSLGLALSGIPFNGADVAGFYRDTTPALASAWYKAGFLFPFFRNHSARHSRRQEPWALGVSARKIIGHYIRLRYKLLPYLYQLFAAQESDGEAILRPLFYDFKDSRTLKLGKIADQFMVGSAILQAPVVEESKTKRNVVLPGSTDWFSAIDGRWLRGGRIHSIRTRGLETPLFVREGSVVPMQAGMPNDNGSDLATIEIHCFVRDASIRGYLHYVCDDGATFAYRKGERSRFSLSVECRASGTLHVEFKDISAAYKPIKVCFVTYAPFKTVTVNIEDGKRILSLAPFTWRFTGGKLKVGKTEFIDLPPTGKHFSRC